MPVAFQPQAVAGVGSGSVGLGVEQVSRHDQIQVAVAIDVVGDHPLDRGDLRQRGQRERAERSVAPVLQI